MTEIEIDPHSTMLRIGLGNYFLAARQPEQAIAEAENMIRRNPSFWRARTLRGEAYAQLGRFELAISDLEAVPDGSQEQSSAWLISALVAVRRGTEARRRVETMVKRSREQYVSPYDLGVMYAARRPRPGVSLVGEGV